MLKLKVGDTVKVLSGRDRGKTADIERINVKKKTLILPGINMYKKHVKGVPGSEKGGIFDVTRPLMASRVALICPKCKKQTRVGFKFVGSEKKRICKKCGRELDLKEVKAKKK
jgi:large subunit ribosomal protein L24